MVPMSGLFISLGLLILGGLTWVNLRQHRQAIRLVKRQLEREETHES